MVLSFAGAEASTECAGFAAGISMAAGAAGTLSVLVPAQFGLASH